jgi:hypothetical protein
MFTQPFGERDLRCIWPFLPFDKIIGEDDERSVSISVDGAEHHNTVIQLRGLTGN